MSVRKKIKRAIGTGYLFDDLVRSPDEADQDKHLQTAGHLTGRTFRAVKGKAKAVSNHRKESKISKRKRLKKQRQKLARKARKEEEKIAAQNMELTSERFSQSLESGASAALARVKRGFIPNRSGVAATSLLAVFGIVTVILLLMFSTIFAAVASEATTLDAYLSDPDDLDAAEFYLSELEMKLQEEVDTTEQIYPDYDEYDYNLGAIGHNPFTLLNYLSAKYTLFTFEEVKAEIDELFSQMYVVRHVPVIVIRQRESEDDDGGSGAGSGGGSGAGSGAGSGGGSGGSPGGGSGAGSGGGTGGSSGEESGDGSGGEPETYEVSIMRVAVNVRSLESIVQARMTDEEKEIYDMYEESKGDLQLYESPIDLYWYLYVTSYYGYRKNPKTDSMELHRGVDIAIPVGTQVKSSQDGTVETAGYDSYYGKYVVIRNEAGYVSKYAHLLDISVHEGDEVRTGDLIGLSGNTGSSIGSELHIECLFEGKYYDPLLYFRVGTKTLYGEEPTGTGGAAVIPTPGGGGYEGGESSDERYQKLMAEAVKYIGYPYVWGGKTPETSFDCSGYVCWCYTHGAGYDLPRAKAQTIFNKCTVISASEARPGDLVFFTKTYQASYPVTHIAIYCGNNTFIHAGNPIGYEKITGYYQRHFYAFGRLPGW